MLVENEPVAGAFTVTLAQNETVSVRVRSAQEANQVIESVLEELNAGNTEKAKELLNEFKQNNTALIQSVAAGKPEEE
ncbi:MAG: hypothetical protein JJU29_11030 [Verrucomicrobia bacterium]|nr:hypothetical protein [Verrucomicrobiota bacterium]MCH8510035.1 hypothetical protein [Kiritimatiellia bacterium]